MADSQQREQAPRKAFHKSAAFLSVLALALVLGACGKKPSSVDPPPDVTEDHFPHVYPDPSTDPKP